MKSGLISLFLMTGAFAASSNVAPASFYYKNATSNAGKKISSSSDGASTLYEYDTVSDNDKFWTTKTICHGKSDCYTTTELDSYTTATSTVDGVLTVLTTAVPVSSSEKKAANNTSDSVATATLDSTTVITITSCSDNKCTKIPETTGLTVVTENDTSYTTYCPLTGEHAKAASHAATPASSAATTTPASSDVTKTELSTTLVTITSCSDHKCSAVTKPTGVVVVTKDKTAYTTYCPLSSESSTVTNTVTKDVTYSTTICPESSIAPANTSTPAAPATTSVPATTAVPSTSSDSTTTRFITLESSSSSSLSTVNVITDNIVTQSPASSTLAEVHSSSAVSTAASVSTYEGAAANFAISSGVLTALLSVAMLFV